VRAPNFWNPGTNSPVPTLLAPFGWAYGLAGKIRWAMARPWKPSIPVLCIGNICAGGAGKTPIALDLAKRLNASGCKVHFLVRGYGGSLKGPIRVDLSHHTAKDVGDEALLLAAQNPCWVSCDRPKGLQEAISAGADVVVMDDGFQNPSVIKDLSLLVVDGAYGLGNERLIPAGPLRETWTSALTRAQGVVIVGEDRHGLEKRLSDGATTSLRATFKPGPEAAHLAGKKVIAFAGIGRPEKFFSTLENVGCKIVSTHAFSDHYPYQPSDIARLKEAARNQKAQLVTTAKDAVRLTASEQNDIEVLTLSVSWDDISAVNDFLSPLIPGRKHHGS
jgi:tetraacyldisaccharide 4'-kinase